MLKESQYCHIVRGHRKSHGGGRKDYTITYVCVQAQHQKVVGCHETV